MDEMNTEFVQEEKRANTKEELLKQALEFEVKGDWNSTMKAVSNLQKKYRKLSGWESISESELDEKFYAAIDAIYAKRNEAYSSVEEAKTKIVEEAKALATSTEWDKTKKKMDELLSAWKGAGRMGNKEAEDALWAQFAEARKAFYDNRQNHFAQLHEKFAGAKQIKENLIEQAKALKESKDFNGTTKKFEQLLEEWKAAGFAGKDSDDKLWAQFSEARKAFYDARSEAYAALREKQNAAAEEKKALIEKANQILASQVFSKTNTETMKGITTEWKGIASAGKQEDGLWQQLRAAMDGYFAGVRTANEERHEQWVAKMEENKAYKQQLILKQKRSIKRLEEEMTSLISESAVANAKDEIEDKKAFIEELEQQIAEIDSKLAESK